MTTPTIATASPAPQSLGSCFVRQRVPADQAPVGYDELLSKFADVVTKTMRQIYKLLGHLFVALGTLGIVLPLLPTTPFLLLAAICYSRGSPKFHAWLLAHRRFGPIIQDWRDHGVIRTRSKVISCLLLSASFSVPLFMLELTIAARFIVGLIGLSVFLFLVTRPSRPRTETVGELSA